MQCGRPQTQTHGLTEQRAQPLLATSNVLFAPSRPKRANFIRFWECWEGPGSTRVNRTAVVEPISRLTAPTKASVEGHHICKLGQSTESPNGATSGHALAVNMTTSPAMSFKKKEWWIYHTFDWVRLHRLSPRLGSGVSIPPLFETLHSHCHSCNHLSSAPA